jgi:hypothetical protein
MKTEYLRALVPLAALVAATTAQAQHCGSCTPGAASSPRLEAAKASYHESSMWPRQYVMPARRGICQSYDVMIANGWRRHNLLTKYHFNPENTELSEAGKLKVEWTLTQAPAQRRTLYVERGVDEAQTAERIEAVQSLAGNMNPSPGPADVQETHIRDEGHPAGAVDAMFTGFRAGQAPPVLPQATAGGSGAEAAQ